MSFLANLDFKLLYGVTIVCALALGDFFYAHRLAADTDVLLVIGAVGMLGVHVAYNTPVAGVR